MRDALGRRTGFTAAGIVAVAALTWAGLHLARDDPAPVKALPADEPGIEHVHGLGLNPVDGRLFVATHFGTFLIGQDRTAERIGESYQDTMGFTVAGDGRLLGSGHPDVAGARRGQPGRLGLIESTDGGVTWQTLSLSGEVDFHTLGFRHGRVYGWDAGSGRFMVSADGRDWDTRSALPLADFAVDPANPDHVVGAGSAGLLDSADGGRTWQPRLGPTLTALSWEPEVGLVGASRDGALHRSADGGASWSAAGLLPAEPEALLVTSGSWYAAAMDRDTTGIYRSTDGGGSWTLYYRDAT